MTTGKRRIPINNHAPGAQDPAAGPAEASDARGRVDGLQTPEVPGREAEAPNSGSPADQDPAARTAASSTAATEAGALNEATRERDTLSDSLLRLRAEFENFRRRAARELIEARDRAQGELLNDLLPVLDNLERALDAAEHHDESKVLGGVRMTRDLFVDLLRRSGVEEIETVGVPFDPHVHDAMLVQSSDQDEGVIAAVLERGYRQGDRVLRPARVAVSSGRNRPADPGATG
ncbi:MAG: nucleotide exchange factor GrpE [bacterium]